MKNIYLVGFMGTGKSTVAKALQKFLPIERVDLDEAIERVETITINEIFAKKGEDYFRNAESTLLGIISKQNNQIVSCGGGVVLRQENIDIMKENGTIVLLSASAKTVWNRVANDTYRPLLKGKNGPKDIEEMINNREEMYKKAADITVCVDDVTPDQVASDIVKQLALTGALN